jgi:XapX domain-containing protein
MKEYILSLLIGGVLGFIFAYLKLPAPAPNAIGGITGIIGIYLGFKLFTLFFHVY